MNNKTIKKKKEKRGRFILAHSFRSWPVAFGPVVG
jgi:hypothetical protein